MPFNATLIKLAQTMYGMPPGNNRALGPMACPQKLAPPPGMVNANGGTQAYGAPGSLVATLRQQLLATGLSVAAGSTRADLLNTLTRSDTGDLSQVDVDWLQFDFARDRTDMDTPDKKYSELGLADLTEALQTEALFAAEPTLLATDIPALAANDKVMAIRMLTAAVFLKEQRLTAPAAGPGPGPVPGPGPTA